MTSAAQTSFAALLRLLRYARGFRARIVQATACSIANKLFDVMPEILIGIAIDVVVRQEDSFIAALGIEDPRWQLGFLGVLTLVIWVAESVFEYLYLVLWRNLAQDLQHGMRLDAYRHVQELDLAYFEAFRFIEREHIHAAYGEDIPISPQTVAGRATNIVQILFGLVMGSNVSWLRTEDHGCCGVCRHRIC